MANTSIKGFFRDVCDLKMAFFKDAAGLIKKSYSIFGKNAISKIGALWAKVTACFAAVCVCFRNVGWSEIASFSAFIMAGIGSMVSVFHKPLRKLAPLFAALASLGAVIIVLRCIFPRRED